MGLRDLFRQHLSEIAASAGEPVDFGHVDIPKPDGMTDETFEELKGMLDAFEGGRLNPPTNLRDAGAWDEYSRNHLQFGIMERAMMDRRASDPNVPRMLRARGAKRILCAGNGFSSEAFALFLFGFDVVALDISGLPGHVFAESFQDLEAPLHQIARFARADDGTVSCPPPQSINAEHCPPMHRSNGDLVVPYQDGGTLRFVTGDLFDPEVCPGPFDAVIERRTVQLYRDDDQATALERLIERLAGHAVFISHEHRGALGSGDERTHSVGASLAARGFVPWHQAGAELEAARLSYRRFTSG